MPARRVFLIESLDAAGGAIADARAHLETLEYAGFPARGVAVELRSGHAPRPEDEPAERGRVALIREREQLLAAVQAARPDLVLVAGAVAGGGIAASWLPAGQAARWWPTGIAAEPGASPDIGPRSGKPSVTPSLDPSSPIDDPVAAGLDWSVLDAPRSRRASLSLWDGDYVLVPAALAGAAGEEALRAFAAVAENWDALDLVVLADPQLGFADLARQLGIGTRVHFAGPAPREAEFAWAASASVMLVGSPEALSGGLVLRALACGCPILPVGETGASRALRGWLERRGLIVPNPVVPGSAFELERILERDARLVESLGRGQALAALQRADRMGPRLAAALTAESQARGRAA